MSQKVTFLSKDDFKQRDKSLFAEVNLKTSENERKKLPINSALDEWCQR